MSNNQLRLQTILSQLREMRLTTMADELHSLYLSEQDHAMTPLDCLEIIVNEEYQIRQDNRIERYKKQANLSHKEAQISEIRYTASRGLRKESVEQLSTNNYIQHHRNVIVQGATGTGKSYLANALVNHAIESGFTGKYYRMTELLNDIDLAEFHGNLDKLLKKLMKVDVLVIDDFLLTSTKEQEQKHLMEVFELRSREKSLILCSQMSSTEWHKKLGGGAIADAILDRACSNVTVKWF
ncbi:ATP-binding protein [Lacicoccus alkaliphilus]|uniref:DNA replication protein DnaC n=1 Tax=Lacicoccus alkaliphilus DSM 16010 TaxID=1123231 RepID=A0A1M7D1H0_9BACL|nr:ATP-binding protein [Salinicoccus alkaliphilus]SHL73217.1 DNA replication protein DnaC [Salinicoccus alkaliphilus DSM 16010]